MALYRDEKGSRRYKTLGMVSRMSKTTAEEELAKLVAPVNKAPNDPTLREYVNGVYLPFCREKWKSSTKQTSEQRLRTHLLADLGDISISRLRRDGMTAYLKEKLSEPNALTGKPNFYTASSLICVGTLRQSSTLR